MGPKTLDLHPYLTTSDYSRIHPNKIPLTLHFAGLTVHKSAKGMSVLADKHYLHDLMAAQQGVDVLHQIRYVHSLFRNSQFKRNGRPCSKKPMPSMPRPCRK